jgi:hypothetical protein
MALLPSSAQGLDEGDVAMFESRAAQADLITALPGAESSAYKNYGLRRSAYTCFSVFGID